MYQRIRFLTVRKKIYKWYVCVCVGGGLGGGGEAYFTRAGVGVGERFFTRAKPHSQFWCVSNNKYIFGLHIGPVPHLWNITVKHNSSKRLWWNKAMGSVVIWSQNTRKPQTGPQWALPQTSQTDWRSGAEEGRVVICSEDWPTVKQPTGEEKLSTVVC